MKPGAVDGVVFIVLILVIVGHLNKKAYDAGYDDAFSVCIRDLDSLSGRVDSLAALLEICREEKGFPDSIVLAEPDSALKVRIARYRTTLIPAPWVFQK